MRDEQWKARLTPDAAGANNFPMRNWEIRTPRRQRKIARALMAAGMMACTGAIGACVNVNAPSEPIVIELNVNIKQEVLYRLVDSAEKNIAENPEIF